MKATPDADIACSQQSLPSQADLARRLTPIEGPSFVIYTQGRRNGGWGVGVQKGWHDMTVVAKAYQNHNDSCNQLFVYMYFRSIKLMSL